MPCCPVMHILFGPYADGCLRAGHSMLIVYAYLLEAAMDAAFAGDSYLALTLSSALAGLDAFLLFMRCLRFNRLGCLGFHRLGCAE